MKLYTFNALLSRMKYITRWGLMRANRAETLSEHTAEVAQLSHTLALIAKNCCGETVRPEAVAVAALYHDASEIVMGDLPTPVKYKNEQMQTAYKALEKEAVLSYLSLMPQELRSEMENCLTEKNLTMREISILKAADKCSALIKCIEEEQSGNTEFSAAKQAQIMALTQMKLPEVDYFLQNMLPAYAFTLDRLMQKS